MQRFARVVALPTRKFAIFSRRFRYFRVHNRFRARWPAGQPAFTENFRI